MIENSTGNARPLRYDRFPARAQRLADTHAPIEEVERREAEEREEQQPGNHAEHEPDAVDEPEDDREQDPLAQALVTERLADIGRSHPRLIISAMRVAHRYRRSHATTSPTISCSRNHRAIEWTNTRSMIDEDELRSDRDRARR